MDNGVLEYDTSILPSLLKIHQSVIQFINNVNTNAAKLDEKLFNYKLNIKEKIGLNEEHTRLLSKTDTIIANENQDSYLESLLLSIEFSPFAIQKNST